MSCWTPATTTTGATRLGRALCGGRIGLAVYMGRQRYEQFLDLDNTDLISQALYLQPPSLLVFSAVLWQLQ